MNAPQTTTLSQCWILSGDSLFSEAIGLAIVSKGLIDQFHAIHPHNLKESIFHAEFEPECLILDGDAYSSEADLLGTFKLLDHYLPDSNLIVCCRDDQWPMLPTAIEYGVRGVVLKSEGIDEIQSVIDAVRNGNARCPAGITAATLQEIRRLSLKKSGMADSGCHLTMREIEVLEHVANGFANKEISKSLGLSISTVKNHLHNIFEKLDCHSRQTAVRNAIAYGFLSCFKDKVFA